MEVEQPAKRPQRRVSLCALDGCATPELLGCRVEILVQLLDPGRLPVDIERPEETDSRVTVAEVRVVECAVERALVAAKQVLQGGERAVVFRVCEKLAGVEHRLLADAGRECAPFERGQQSVLGDVVSKWQATRRPREQRPDARNLPFESRVEFVVNREGPHDRNRTRLHPAARDRVAVLAVFVALRPVRIRLPSCVAAVARPAVATRVTATRCRHRGVETEPVGVALGPFWVFEHRRGVLQSRGGVGHLTALVGGVCEQFVDIDTCGFEFDRLEAGIEQRLGVVAGIEQLGGGCAVCPEAVEVDTGRE